MKLRTEIIWRERAAADITLSWLLELFEPDVGRLLAHSPESIPTSVNRLVVAI